MKEEKQKCEGMFWNGFYNYQCSRNASAEVDGKHYCGTHNPIKIKERYEKKSKQWDKELAEKIEKREYEAASVNYCKKMNLTIEQLKDVLCEGGEKQ